MPEKDVLFSISLPDGTKTTLNQEQYSQAQDKLFAKFPDAQVSRVQSYVGDDDDMNDTDSYHIQLPDGTSTTLDATQFASNRQKIQERFPDAQIARISDMSDRYWRPKLEEARAALAAFDEQNSAAMSAYEESLRGSADQTRSANWDTPARQYEREHRSEYNTLKQQREALGNAVFNNPIITRGRKQAYEGAMALRDEYLKLAEQAEDRAVRRDYKRAAKLQGDAAELFSAPGQFDKNNYSNGFRKYLEDYKAGMVNTFSDRDFWTRGLTQIARDIDLHGIRKKVQDEEKRIGRGLDERDFDRILSTSEKAELLSFYNLARAQEDDVIGRSRDLASAYKAGQSSAESMGFWAEFLLSQGFANWAGKAMSASANGLTRWLGQSLMSEKALNRAVAKGITTIPEMNTWQKVGTEMARPLVQGLWHTPTQLSTYSNIVSMMNQTNDNDELNSVGRSIWLGLADSFVENWSESLGNTMDKGFERGLEWAGNKLGASAIGKSSFGRMARWAYNSNFNQTLKEAGFNGFIGEMLEEWAGNAVRVGTGLMSKKEFGEWGGDILSKDEAKRDKALESQLEMAASFAPMSLIGLGGNTISAVRRSQEYAKVSDKVKDLLIKSNVSQAEINDIFNTKYDTAADIAAKIAPYAKRVVDNGGASAEETIKDFIDLSKEMGAKAYIDAMKELEAQEQRDQVRDAIASKTGQFWQEYSPVEEGGAPVDAVHVVRYADGTRKYIVEGTEQAPNGVRMYATVDENGNKGFINDIEIKQGLEDGTITANEEMGLNEYLQQQVDAVKKDAEAQRMQREAAQQLNAIRARIAENPSFNMGTPEQPVNATVVKGTENKAGATVMVDTGDGQTMEAQLSWKEIGEYIGTPISVKTDEQLNEDAAAAQQEAIDRKDKYNAIPVGTRITVTLPGAEGDEQVPYQFVKAIYDENEGSVRIYVADENGNVLTGRDGEEVWFPEEMVVGLDAVADEAIAKANTPAEEEAPAAEEAPAVAPVQKYTNAEGKVNQTAFFKNEPEEWTKWNDARRNDGGANSKERLAASISGLEKEMAELNKKKAATANPDDAEALEMSVNELAARYTTLKSIYDRYIAAEQAAKAAEDEARRAEFEAAAAKKKEAEKKASAKIQDDLKEDASFVELAENYAEQPKTYGDTDTYNVGGRKFKGRWVVAEATTPKPSHNPLNGFAPTPGYPIGKAGNSNHYDKDKRAQEITREMSNPFDERAVQEPVVVTKHGIVLSGNGRTQARLLAAQQQTDTDYEQYIKEHASKWGLTAEEIDQYQNPMLYFELEEDVEYTAALFDAFNRSTSKQQSVTETAAKVAQMTSEELVMRLDRLFREIGDNIDNLYKDPQQVNELLNMLQAAGIFNANERARFVDEYGNLSGAGEDLVESVLFGTIFSSSDESVRAAMNDKAIRRAVAFAFPTLVRLRNLNEQYSLANELGEAVSLVAAAKAANGGKAENAVIDYMLQGDVFTGETPMVKATVQLLAHVLNDSKYGALRSVLNQYIERAELANYGQADMFGGDVETKEQILRDVLAHNNINIEVYGNQAESAGQSGVPADDAVRPASGEQGSSGNGADASGAEHLEGVPGEGAPASEGEPVDPLKVAKEQAAKNRLAKKLQKRIAKWKKFLGDGAFDIATGIEDIEKIEDAATRAQVLQRQQQNGDVEGWFANGKAVIYLPNIPDTRTLDRKIMHEVIAHKGIKGLFEGKGEGEFDKFLDWTWGNLMNEAARSYYMNYPGVAEIGDMQKRQRAAADEFLAHCAEKETAVIAEVDDNFWSRLVEALKNFINDAMGDDVFDTEDGWFADLLKQAAQSVQEGEAPSQQDEENTLLSVRGTKEALASAVPGDESPFKATDVTSADGTKILNNLEQFADDAKNLSFRGKNSFVKTLGSKLGAKQEGSNSLYATFEAKNGTVFTIRLADHNAKVSNFDNRDEDNGVSIVISRRANSGITNDGTAQVEEFFYSDKALRNSDDNAYEKIVRAVIQSLYSGSYKDTTGLATYEKVNGEEVTTNAIPNEMTEGNVLFSVGDGGLVGMHNISERKLRSAIRTGGLANPSLAVIDVDNMIHEDYGDISLIAPSSLIDTRKGRNAGTYNGDAWTPTYPGVSKKMSDKGWDKFFDQVRVLPEPFSHQVRNDWREYLDDDRMGRSLKWWFLQDTGRNPETVYNTSSLSEEDKELVRSFSGKKIFGTDEDASKAIEMFRRLADPEEVERAGRKIEIKVGKPGRHRDWAIARNEDIDSWGIFTAPVVDFIEELQRQVRYEGTIAEQSTYQSAEDFVRDNNLDGEFQQWLQDKEKEFGVKEVLFAGWTPDGDKKYVPNTVENASRLMNKEPDQNAYGNGGLSATRSLLLERMDTLEEIRQNRGQLADIRGYASETPEYEAASSNWFNVIEALANMQKISDNQFSNIDYAEARLQEAIQERNPIAYLNKEYRYHIPEDGEFAEALKASLKEIKALPSKYFETKFNRPVYLNEFAAAVIPTDTAEGVRKELEKAGLPIYEYDSKKEGARQEAVLQASQEDGVRFSVGGEQEQPVDANSKEFKEWFKGSKVVDENGNPLVVYRGATFDPLSMADGLGVIKPQAYFSPSEEYARRYGPWTRSYYLNIQNPFDIRNKKDLEIYKKMLPDGYVIAKTGSGAADWAEFGAAIDIDTLMDNHPEYDGIILDEGGDPDGNGGVTSRGVSYIPLRGGAQVKSAEANNGQFSPENPDVRFSVTPEQDAEYMQAVEDGDMEKAKEMVRAAAKAAMPGTVVVDEDGAPKVVYHGSYTYGFNEFATPGEPLQGAIWLSTDFDYATIYSNYGIDENESGIYDLYADIKNPLNLGYIEDVIGSDVWNKIAESLNLTPEQLFDSVSEGFPGGYENAVDRQYIYDFTRSASFVNLLKSKGYDGMVAIENRQRRVQTYAALNSNQVKSAKPIERDDEGNVIPLSQRFNDGSNDIRFSIRRYHNFATAQMENKIPGKEYPELEDADVRFSLSKNNRATVEAWLRKRGDLTDEQRRAVVDYLDTMNNATLQLATAKWFSQGVVRLPEDMDKVEQAVSVAGKAKVDPLQYNSPMELLDAHAGFEASEKRIDPNTVPTLHKVAEYPEHGVVIYDVDPSQESRENMRKIINSHFGKEASPWCLLQGDGNGNLTSDSERWWKHYNGYKKQVAFKDGKLLAFSANDSSTRVWWDRQDKPHAGIPVIMKMPGDELGRSATYEYNPKTGEIGNPTDIHKGNKQNGLYELWSDEGIQIVRANYKDGRLDGLCERWHRSTGKRWITETLKNGRNVGDYTEWWPDGSVKNVAHYDEDGFKIGDWARYHENGKKAKEEHFEDGLHEGEEIYWNSKGDMIARTFYKDGKQDGVYERWYDNDKPEARSEFKNGRLHGEAIAWWANGDLLRKTHYVNGVEVGPREEWYESGNKARIVNYNENGEKNGEEIEYWDLAEGRNPIGHIARWKDGKADGLQEYFRANGAPERREMWKDGKKNGLSESFWGEGVLRERANYKNNERHGITETFESVTGNILSRSLWEDGNIIEDLPIHDSEESTENNARLSIVTDEKEIERLEKEPTVTLYRAMELIDGQLYPPMSQKVPNSKSDKGKKMQRREGVVPGMWQKSDEDPSKAYQKEEGGPWYYDLKKTSGSDVNGVLYNPYLHLSASPLNDQFSAASTRPNLVTVACEVPVSELSSGYKAEKANDSVGAKDWHSGTVTAQLGNGRQVVLSRWAKISRIVPDTEVAAMVAPGIVEKNIYVPVNVVTPSLRAALEARGVKFAEPEADVRFSVEDLEHDDMLHAWGMDIESYEKRFQEADSIEDKEAVLRDYAERVKTPDIDIDFTSTENLKGFLMERGLSDEQAQAYVDVYSNKPRLFGEYNPKADIAFFLVDRVPSVSALRDGIVHEREHRRTRGEGRGSELLRRLSNAFGLQVSPDVALNEMTIAARALGMDVDSYIDDRAPIMQKIGILADEIISYGMQRKYSDKDFENTLKKSNIAKDAIKLINDLYNEGRRTIISRVEPDDGLLYDGVSESARGGDLESLEGSQPGTVQERPDQGADDDGHRRGIEEGNGVRFAVANEHEAVFISNAMNAVRGIPMQKATPQQWLKMIESRGGLKAGEDKWIGLSDWLKASDAKTLTKDEVEDYIAQNQINIKEVRYSEEGQQDWTLRYEKEYQQLFDEAPFEEDSEDYAFEKMVEKYGDDFEKVFESDGYNLFARMDEEGNEYAYPELAERFFGDKPIESTRLIYTSEGLANKREVALTVPTIHPWNKNDDIHFGDAGEGRAIAWSRFGDAVKAADDENVESAKKELEKANEEYHEYRRFLLKKYNVNSLSDILVVGTDEEKAERQRLAKIADEKFKALEDLTAGTNGNRVLFIDEIQSKRHQEGREYGYMTKEESEAKKIAGENLSKAQKSLDAYRQAVADLLGIDLEIDAPSLLIKLSNKAEKPGVSDEERANYLAYHKNLAKKIQERNAWIEETRKFDDDSVPDAPFEKNWHELAMKRMLRLAADEGYDYVAWTRGEQQAERYNLKKMVSEIAARADGNGNYYVVIEDKHGFELNEFSGAGKVMAANEMVSYFGKDLAMRLMTGADQSRGKKWSGKGYNPEFYTVRGDDLQVGGEGMKGFYDEILPRYMDKYLKKWGVKTEDLLVNAGGIMYDSHSVKVTPEMRESVKQGQVMFSVRAAADARRDGIGAVIGSENVNDFYMGLYSALTPEMRKDIVEKTLGGSLDFVDAMQEYVSGVAAKGYQNDDTGILLVAESLLNDYAGEPINPYAAQYILWRGTRGVDENDLLDVAHDQFMWNYLKVEDYPDNPDDTPDGPGKGSIEAAREETDTNPSDAQKEAGNYKHGHVSIDGYNISLENPKGSVRSGKDASGKEWSVIMNNDYGYIRMTKGIDGDQIDVFLSDNPAEGNVFVIDQVDPKTGEFDEHKVMYGFNSVEEASQAYLSNYSEGWKGLGAITEVSKDEFRKWIDSSRRKTKPFAEYKSVETLSGQSGTRFSVSDSMNEADKAAEAAIDEAQERLRQDKKDLKDILTAAKAMSLQKTYDKSTVETVTNLAKRILKDQFVDALSRREVARLLGIVRTSVGKSPKSVKKNADAIVELVIDNLLKREKQGLDALSKVVGTKTSASGVTVKGELDINGQKILKYYRDATKKVAYTVDAEGEKRIDTTPIDVSLADAYDDLNSNDNTIKAEAEVRIAGLELAKDYLQTIQSLNDVEDSLEEQRKELDKDYKNGDISKTDYNECVIENDAALRRNRIDLIEALREHRAKLQGVISGSKDALKAQRDAEKARIEHIHHIANSDMEGIPTDEPGDRRSLLNKNLFQTVMGPLVTFNQFFRLFGRKNAYGLGYLYNWFVRKQREAQDNETIGLENAREAVNTKVAELLGEGKNYDDLKRYAAQVDRENRRDGREVKMTFLASGGRKEHVLDQTQLMYIYMVNKMNDGRMKLRRMGITQEMVDAIVPRIDSKLIQFADWAQEEFLVELRNKYNSVYERMWGASMAAIENYFPLKIDKRDLEKAEDIASDPLSPLPSTTTGAIIKRTINNRALDLLNADALDILNDHLFEMEHWAAFAEYIKDVNTLISYRRFHNQVTSMKTVYGTGETLWKNFRDVLSISIGNYHPTPSKADKFMTNSSRAFSVAKVSFRLSTAIKQLASITAFIPEVSVKNMAIAFSNPVEDWKWAIENMPSFRARLNMQNMGNEKLLPVDSDLRDWTDGIVRWLQKVGMAPNKFIDALTISVGSRAVYLTKKEEYLKLGYSEEESEKRAIHDTETVFNETQQSSEGGFLAPIQRARDFWSTTFSTFRNSSFGYTRKAFNSMRALKRMLSDKDGTMAFMTKQFVREGFSEEQAAKNAERQYNRAKVYHAATIATNFWVNTLFWNLFGHLWYFLFGDDDDKKIAYLEEDVKRALYGGPIEGLAGGNVISQMIGNLAMKENMFKYSPSLNPLLADAQELFSTFKRDSVKGMNDLVNLGAQIITGVNPQTFTDTIVAIVDACNGDLDTAKEAMILIMRVIQAPQSQIDEVFIDELGMNGSEARRMSYQQLAKRYAEYKVNREAPLTGWAYSEEERKKKVKSKESTFKNKVNDRKELKKK